VDSVYETLEPVLLRVGGRWELQNAAKISEFVSQYRRR
jgi:hypothetical protein